MAISSVNVNIGFINQKVLWQRRDAPASPGCTILSSVLGAVPQVGHRQTVREKDQLGNKNGRGCVIKDVAEGTGL